MSTLPHDRVGLEILENQEIDDAFVAAVIEAREQGFCVALDDFELGTDSDRLLEHVDVIKLDMMALGRDGLTDHVARLRHLDAELLVEKVETPRGPRFRPRRSVAIASRGSSTGARSCSPAGGSTSGACR